MKVLLDTTKAEIVHLIDGPYSLKFDRRIEIIKIKDLFSLNCILGDLWYCQYLGGLCANSYLLNVYDINCYRCQYKKSYKFKSTSL
jgi:hypothetical protein